MSKIDSIISESNVKLTIGSARILFLDHEREILATIISYARSKGWLNVETINDPSKAKKLCVDGDVDVLVSDLSMGEINGVEFLEDIYLIMPKLNFKVILAIYSGLGKISDKDIRTCEACEIHILPAKQTIDLDPLFRELSFIISPEEREIKKNIIFTKNFEIIDDENESRIRPQEEENDDDDLIASAVSLIQELESLDDPNIILYQSPEKSFTVKELAAEIRSKSEIGKSFIRSWRKAQKKIKNL